MNKKELLKNFNKLVVENKKLKDDAVELLNIRNEMLTERDEEIKVLKRLLRKSREITIKYKKISFVLIDSMTDNKQ